MPRILLVFCAATFMLTATALAQALDADERALASYRLTMPTVKKVMSAVEYMFAEMAKDPKVQERTRIKAQIRTLSDKEELSEAEQEQLEKLQERENALDEEIDRSFNSGNLGNAKTLAEMEAGIRQQPLAMRALSQAGVTPREYALCMMALLQASMVEGFSGGKADLTKLPPGVNPENVKFVREHKDALAAMQKGLADKPKQ